MIFTLIWFVFWLLGSGSKAVVGFALIADTLNLVWIMVIIMVRSSARIGERR